MSSAIEVIPAVETQSAITDLAVELHSNFVHDGEKWTIDLSNPPSLEESYNITEKILQFKKTASNISDQSNWLIGNVVMTCRDYFGEEFDIIEVGDITGSSYQTLITSESVYLFFGDRRVEGMSFSHHKEVYYTKDLSDSEKFMTLELAKDCDLSTKDTRKLASYVKNEGSDILVDEYEPIEVINILENYKKDTEPVYVCITYDKVTSKVKRSNMDDDKMSRFQTIIEVSPELMLIKHDLE